MSASTVSITANDGYISRRRISDKNLPGASTFAAAETDAQRKSMDTAADAIVRDVGRNPARNMTRSSGPVRKAKKPIWLTAMSILAKNLALVIVLIGFVQMVRWVVLQQGREAENLTVVDFDGKLSSVEKFVKTSLKAMQLQINAIDVKVGDKTDALRKEISEKIEKNGEEMDLKLKAFDARNDVFEKFMDDFQVQTKGLLSKDEFGEFFDEFKKARKNAGTDAGEVTLDDVIGYARDIVEKEIQKHSADGLGMVDYALASGGGRIIKHSEPFGVSGLLLNLNRVSAEAEKMIRPSFGEPGQCFPLKGTSGFVEIKLRAPIVPEAVTLEHVAKSVAFDRSSAPQHCRVYGWLQGQVLNDVEDGNKKMFALTEFTYDLEKSYAQTFKVELPLATVVDTVRLDIVSNHGSASHTCIYRLRVHGSEPNSILASKMQL